MKMKRRICSMGTAIVLCLVLITVYVFPVFAAPQADLTAGSWAEEIPAMLSAGSYAEGEVIAGVVASGRLVSGDALLSESEEVIDVSGDDVASAAGTAVKNDEIDIVYIQRADMTTEEILYRLAFYGNSKECGSDQSAGLVHHY